MWPYHVLVRRHTSARAVERSERSHFACNHGHHDECLRMKLPLMLVRGTVLAIFRMEFQKWSAVNPVELPDLTGRGAMGECPVDVELQGSGVHALQLLGLFWRRILFYAKESNANQTFPQLTTTIGAMPRVYRRERLASIIAYKQRSNTSQARNSKLIDETWRAKKVATAETSPSPTSSSRRGRRPCAIERPHGVDRAPPNISFEGIRTRPAGAVSSRFVGRLTDFHECSGLSTSTAFLYAPEPQPARGLGQNAWSQVGWSKRRCGPARRGSPTPVTLLARADTAFLQPS